MLVFLILWLLIGGRPCSNFLEATQLLQHQTLAVSCLTLSTLICWVSMAFLTLVTKSLTFWRGPEDS